jgi:hypothetical protein
MDHESGQLSIDFIIGFGIFLIAFIFVAVLVSGLLVGLQSKTIDYDAVAYRTSVILVEDPGWSSFQGTRWESESDLSNIVRIGLAFSKDDPNILSINKVEQFFNNSPRDFFNSPDDYRDKLLLSKTGQYPYHFNVTLSGYPSVGDGANPNNSGFMKRVVLIREPPRDLIQMNSLVEYVNVSIDLPNLTSNDRGALFKIYPDESITITLEKNASLPALQLLHANLTYPGLNLTQKVLIDNQTWVEEGSGLPNAMMNYNITTGEIPLRYFYDLGLGNEDGIFVFQFNTTGGNITSVNLSPWFKKSNLTVRIW